ncbi:hypothetical protein KQJ29_31445 [Enterococcus sp. S181_ASV_20]|nr:hypothetical protein [Enterococcus sp. S181_ASV_20]
MMKVQSERLFPKLLLIKAADKSSANPVAELLEDAASRLGLDLHSFD